jgi:membrane associated rhomboid family serine protease
MPNPSLHPLELILRLCAEKAPEPWYPGDYAKEMGMARDSLDPYLDQLRMGGLTRLTDWVSGHGQGYALTPAGQEILKNPRQLARLLSGKWSPPAVRENRSSASASSPWERGEAVRAALIYPVQPVATFMLIAINVAAFIFQTQSAQFENLLVADPVGLIDNQWWRLLTTAFLHGGILHLGMNMMALYSLGRVTEQLWGHARYLAIYVVGALGSTCLALISRLNPPIGASGAVCAVFSSWAVWFFYNRQHLPPPLFFAWQRNFFINIVLLVFISLFPGISWEGHLGGAIAGGILALWFCLFQMQTGWRRWLQWVGVLVIPVVSVGLLVRTMHSGGKWRQVRDQTERHEMSQYLAQIDSFEQRAIDFYNQEVVPILEMRARGRDQQEVDRVVKRLNSFVGDLDNSAERLRLAGPFLTSFVERGRQLQLLLLEAEISFFKSTVQCLESGDQWTEKDQKQLNEQGRLVEKAQEEWAAHMKHESRH